MCNTHIHPLHRDNAALAILLSTTKQQERQACALAISIRLEALASYISTQDMSGTEAVELLRQEATRFEQGSQELH